MTDRCKALAMTEDLDDLMCPHSAAGRPERFPAKACILAGECGCVYGAEWSRALRLTDDAALERDPEPKLRRAAAMSDRDPAVMPRWSNTAGGSRDER